MKKIKCNYKECERVLEVEDHIYLQYCSFECAAYDGTFSVKKGWNKDKLKEKIHEAKKQRAAREKSITRAKDTDRTS